MRVAQYSTCMARCIYCHLDGDGGATFNSVEHVFPDGFGGFKNALTLADTVCDGCNRFFGNTIDMYLTRDTPMGLMRFFAGQKAAAEYKHLGRRSQLRHQVGAGRLARATLVIERGEHDLIIKPRAHDAARAPSHHRRAPLSRRAPNAIARRGVCGTAQGLRRSSA